MLGAVVCFVVMSALVKLVREAGMGTAEVMVWRMAPGLPLVAIQMRRRGISWLPRRPGAVIMRSVCGGLAMALYFWALESLTLLQYSVIGLSQPVLVAVLAVPLLNERLRGSALAALPVALAGAALVLLPDALLWRGDTSALDTIPALAGILSVVSATCSALAHTFVRRATGPSDPRGRPADAPETVVMAFSLVVTLGALGVGLAQGQLRGPPPTLSTVEALALLLPMALVGVLGQLMLSAAYARDNAPRTAIVGYARIPLGLLADVIVWGTVAESSGLVGALLVFVAGGLLISDRRTDRPTNPPTTGPSP